MNEEVLNIIANEYLYGSYCVNERMIENIHWFIQLLMKEWLKANNNVSNWQGVLI